MMKLFNRSLALSLLALCSLASAKSKIKGFKLESTTNVGYPQDELPNQVLIDGEPNPCYFQVGDFGGLNTVIHHGSAAEPSVAVNPKNPRNIVACWQQDRMRNGGALECGIAYTHDGGKTWHQNEIPVQLCEGGISQRVTDVWLSFACDGKLYLNMLCLNSTPTPDTPNQGSISTSISKDGGKTWSLPISSYGNSSTASTTPFQFPDKNAITADPNHRKNAYIVWDTFVPGTSFTGPTYISRTTDGGITWTPGAISYDMFPDLCSQGLSQCDPSFLTPFTGAPLDNGTQTIGNIIVALPQASPCDKLWKNDTWGDDANKAKRFSGNLLNVFQRFYPTPTATAQEYWDDAGPLTYYFYLTDTAIARSQDQGSNWNTTATVIVPNTDYAGNGAAVQITPTVVTGGYNYDGDGNPFPGGTGRRMRTGSIIPSIAVNPRNGFLYTVYQTGQFRNDFLPQIGISTSRDGGYTWSERVRINRTPQDAPNPQAFTAFVAVTEDGYVGVLYSDFRNDPAALPNNNPETLSDTWLAIYKEVAGPGSTGIGLNFVQEIRLSATSYIAQNGPTTSGGIMTNGDYSFLVTHENNFYACFTQPHEGPFTPDSLFYEDLDNNVRILLDDNYRQSPYVSIVKPVKSKSCKK